jgi:hypothetical protein
MLTKSEIEGCLEFERALQERSLRPRADAYQLTDVKCADCKKQVLFRLHEEPDHWFNARFECECRASNRGYGGAALPAIQKAAKEFQGPFARRLGATIHCRACNHQHEEVILGRLFTCPLCDYYFTPNEDDKKGW